MSTTHPRPLAALASVLFLAVAGPALAENVSLSGQVRGYNGNPIEQIEVTVYHDRSPVTHVYTDAEGKYSVAVPTGEPITVRFDTHWSLNNSRSWHPSVVANLDSKKDISLDRLLMGVGMGESETAAVDALSAYEFCAMWALNEPNKAYSTDAAFRLSQMKLSSQVLRDLQKRLQDHFGEQAKAE
jgi:hypothetical protein